MRKDLIGSFIFSKRQQNSVGDATRAKGAHNTTRSVVTTTATTPACRRQATRRDHYISYTTHHPTYSRCRLSPRGISIAMDTHHTAEIQI
ncbi:MAG: hypothetical protein IJU90_05215 [Bacteroidales bacterium]|nr:hypothetical protein [Bacteroidales bacterium]